MKSGILKAFINVQNKFHIPSTIYCPIFAKDTTTATPIIKTALTTPNIVYSVRATTFANEAIVFIFISI